MASRARAWLLLWALCALPAVECVILVNVASPLSKELCGVAVVTVGPETRSRMFEAQSAFLFWVFRARAWEK